MFLYLLFLCSSEFIFLLYFGLHWDNMFVQCIHPYNLFRVYSVYTFSLFFLSSSVRNGRGFERRSQCFGPDSG